MEQRLSVITLGVADVGRAQRFYEALGRHLDDGIDECGGRPRVRGGYAGVLTDPDGHPWESGHDPARTVHADGATTLHPTR